MAMVVVDGQLSFNLFTSLHQYSYSPYSCLYFPSGIDKEN